MQPGEVLPVELRQRIFQRYDVQRIGQRAQTVFLRHDFLGRVVEMGVDHVMLALLVCPERAHVLGPLGGILVFRRDQRLLDRLDVRVARGKGQHPEYSYQMFDFHRCLVLVQRLFVPPDAGSGIVRTTEALLHGVRNVRPVFSIFFGRILNAACSIFRRHRTA